MLVGAFTDEIGGHDDKIYQAIILSQALKDIESVYSVSVTDVCISKGDCLISDTIMNLKLGRPVSAG